jgi:hypothetical protein
MQERKSFKAALMTFESHTSGGAVTDLAQAFKLWKRNIIKRNDYLHA